MFTMASQLQTRRSLLMIPNIFKGIVIKLSLSPQLAVWVLTTPTILMARQLYSFLRDIILRSINSPFWSKPSWNFFDWSGVNLSNVIPSLSVLFLSSPAVPKKLDLPEVDSRFVTLNRLTPPLYNKPRRSIKRKDNPYHQALLNSAVKRYREYLNTLGPLQLTNLYRSNFFLHARYFPSASLLDIVFESLRKRAFKDRACRSALINQLVNQALGKTFLNPQAVYCGIASPLGRPLPALEALRFIKEKLPSHELLR